MKSREEILKYIEELEKEKNDYEHGSDDWFSIISVVNALKWVLKEDK